MTAVVVVFAFAFGASIGSFLTVVAHRVPRHESLSNPPSHCPSCNTPLAWRDNVPVFGWLFLRGRCRYCKAAISPRYPLIELAAGATLVAGALLVVR